MKIFLAQQNYHIGNFEQNTQKIIAAIETAKAAGADLVVFSEMSICGYTARDFVEFNDCIDKCYEAIHTIKMHTQNIGEQRYSVVLIFEYSNFSICLKNSHLPNVHF
jgi:NAD+ synthase (glutamine-hydrolysing)